MISSMTGYAVVSRDIGRAVLQIELRSINSRYLDLSFRIVEELRFAEPLLRELINASVSRGKLECRLSLQASNSARSDLVINDVMLNQLLTAQECIKLRAPDATVLSIGEMLRWPGVLSEDGVNNDQLNPQLQEVCREALAERGRFEYD